VEPFPIEELVRQFPDRALRWVLELPENVRGLLRLAELPFVDDLEFTRMRRLKLSTIHDNLREEIPDVLHELPLRLPPDRTLGVCILAEHSSTRMRTARTRLLRGMANAWWEEERQWDQRNVPEGQRIPRLIIGGLLYTGEAPWREPPQLAELLELPEPIAEYAVSFKMFFVDPAQLPEEMLDLPDEPFAWLMKLFRAARAPTETFLTTFREVLLRLSRLPGEAGVLQRRLAWVADLMAHHRRPAAEREQVSVIINEVVPQFLPKEEVHIVSETIADYYVQAGRQEGRQEGQRDLFLKLLQRRFGTIPPHVSKRVQSIQDPDRLSELSFRLLDAKRLEDLGLS
jgi:hypothetical protein